MALVSQPNLRLKEPLHVVIDRPMWGEFFTLLLSNGQTEELDTEETKAWFKIRGANMDKMDKVLDHVWNFGHAEIDIENPKEPPITRLPYAPDI